MPAPEFGDQTLCDHLQVVARRLRRQAQPLAHIVYTAYGAGFDAEEFTTLSLSSAFLAFTTLGGDVEHPEAFDWAGQAEALHRVGLSYLRTDLGGRHTQFGDAAKRYRVRREFSCCEALAWSAWAGISPTTTAGMSATFTAARYGRYGVHTGSTIDRAFEQSILLELDEALQTLLTPKEYALLRAHYFEGVPQRQLAETIAAHDGSYQDEGGVKRAEKMVNKVLSRARQKLERTLPPQWRAMTQEVA